MKVLLPSTGAESLNCDKCNVFLNYVVNDERERTPDFLVYLALPGHEPRFCLVEFKEQPDTHAVSQLKEGIKVLTEHADRFKVVPQPQRLECVIARNRSKGAPHAAQLGIILNRRLPYRGKPIKIRLLSVPDKLFPDIDASYY